MNGGKTEMREKLHELKKKKEIHVKVFKTEEKKKRETTRRVQVKQIPFQLQLSFLMHHSVKGCFMLYN